MKNGQGTAKRKSNARSAAENVLTLLEQFGFTAQDFHVHLNFPGGIPVDGPSAGVAMFLAVYSAFTEIPVAHTLALTGEVGLHGQVLPVGGVEQKLAGGKGGRRGEGFDSGAELEGELSQFGNRGHSCCNRAGVARCGVSF